MSIYQKLILIALAPAALILSVAHYSSRESEASLRNVIERTTIAESSGIVDEIDYVVHTRIAEWQAYIRSQIIQSALRDSNTRFARRNNLQELIDIADQKWRERTADKNPLLSKLLEQPLSRDLSNKIEKLKLTGGELIYGEVFVTNRYGVNAAQTNRTSDYRQDDEKWWQLARKNGLYVGDMALDESSGVYATEICLRIDDDRGEFMGVLKAVLNIEEAISILNRHTMKEKDAPADSDCFCRMSLLTSDGRLVHSTCEEMTDEKIKCLEEFGSIIDGSLTACEGTDCATGKPMLTTYASSEGYSDFAGLGWGVLTQVSADRVFAPVHRLRKRVRFTSASVAGLAALIGILLAWSMSKRIRRLTNATKELRDGNEYTDIPVQGHDELSELALSFNHMANGLTSAREALVCQAELLETRNASLENEIEQRCRSEKERAELNKKLVESSRQAGMAEVATGVLHNVGNVLNSVNVSANLLMEELTKSRVNKLSAAAKILNQQGDRLGDFLTNDERGRHFPKLLNQLSENLSEERDNQLAELQSLVDHIYHIKQVVVSQQTLARSGGQYEHIDLRSVVENALNMAQTGLKRHHVQVELVCEPMPPIITDKHKVLQVLINLISNAKAALCKSGTKDKRLRLRVEQGTDARISVTDNGIGIPYENLTKIFSHGFSTKPDGHGFGLHSCAIAAQAIGGSLTAQSDGINQGATFTFTIPIEQNAEKGQRHAESK